MNHRKVCCKKNCEAYRMNHLWGAIKAHEKGWIELKDGRTYCPEHTPVWVKSWREKRKNESRQT